MKEQYLREVACSQTLVQAVSVSGVLTSVRVEPAEDAANDEDEGQTETRHQDHRQHLGACRYDHRHDATHSDLLSHDVTLTSLDHSFSVKVY